MRAPIPVVRGIRIRIAAINSTTPEPILPASPNSNFSKSSIVSGAPVNLKNNV